MIKKCVRFNLDANKIHTTYGADEYDRSYLSALLLIPLLKLRSDAIATAEQQQHKTTPSDTLGQKLPATPSTALTSDDHSNTASSQDYTSSSTFSSITTPPTTTITALNVKRRRPKITPLDLSMIPNAKRRYPPSIYEFTTTAASTIDELSC